MEKKLVKLVAEKVVERIGDVVLKNGNCGNAVRRRDVAEVERRGGMWEVVANVEWYFYISFLSPENDLPREELIRGLEYLELGVNQCYVEDVEAPFRRYLELRSDLILVEDINGRLYMRYRGRYYLSPYWERLRPELKPYPEVPRGVVCGAYYKFKLGRIVGREGNWYAFEREDGERVRAWKDPIVPARFCLPQ